MKQVEKLDLLLKTLYQSRFEGYYPLTDIWLEKDLPIEMKPDLKKLSKQLQCDAFIDTLFAGDECFAQITQQGIDYCQRDSYTTKGRPVIANLYIYSNI